MSGLPPRLLTPLRSLLMQLDHFKDAAELQALFEADARLATWKDRLPDLNGVTLAGRVNLLIAYLLPQKDRHNQSGLVLFLHVLAEDLSPQDANRQQLNHLAQQITAWFNETTAKTENLAVSGSKHLLFAQRNNPVPVAPLSPQKLLDILLEYFNLEELKRLCFDLEVEYDDLRGESRASKAQELIEYMNRRNRLEELTDEMRRQRSGIEWPSPLSQAPTAPVLVTEQSVAFAHFKLIFRMQSTNWHLQVQNTSQQNLKRITLLFHTPATLWVNPNRLNIGDLDALHATEEMSLSVSSRQPSGEFEIEAVYLASGASGLIRSRQSCQFFV